MRGLDPAGRARLDVGEHEARADTRACFHRRDKAQRVEAIVHPHGGAFDPRDGFEGHRRQQRKRQETVSDGAAKRRFLRGPFRVTVEKLVIVGRIGECIDHLLRNRAPGRNADLLADACLDVFQRYGSGTGLGHLTELLSFEQGDAVLYRLAAIQRQDRARDMASGAAAQIEGRAGNVIRHADTAQRNLVADALCLLVRADGEIHHAALEGTGEQTH